jgi:integral membrane sensor domain MASE1
MSFAAVLSTVAGAAGGSATLVAFGMSDSFVQLFKIWWGNCAMAVLLLSPFVFSSLSRQQLHYLLPQSAAFWTIAKQNKNPPGINRADFVFLIF